jgi:hypothetical protein
MATTLQNFSIPKTGELKTRKYSADVFARYRSRRQQASSRYRVGQSAKNVWFPREPRLTAHKVLYFKCLDESFNTARGPDEYRPIPRATTVLLSVAAERWSNGTW